MKKNNNQSTEVLEVDAEEMLPEIPLEKVIENTLVKANVTDQVITALKEKYGNMRLANIEDKETYLDIKEARKEVRKVGIITEKLCKKGREDAVAIQRKWLAKEKEILGKIAEVENPLNEEIEKFDNEVERKELEAEKKREEVYINRQSTLSKMGAIYDNGSFVLNHISYEVALLKEADNDMWNDTILPKYRKVFEEIESVRVAEENKRKEEIAQQKKEREEFEAKQKEFKEQQEAFAKQQSELQKQKDEVERQQRIEQERKESELRQKKQTVTEARLKRLANLNIRRSPYTDDYLYIDENINIASELKEANITIPYDLYSLSDTEWESLTESISPLVEQKKKDTEEKRTAQLEKEKQAAIELAAQQEREKIAVEQKLAELEKQKDAIRKQQELEAAKDKEKYAAVVEYLKHYPNLVMTSNFYKGKMNEINDFINDL